MDSRGGHWRWHIVLVHVCRRWRHIVFTSSGRLNLRLICTAGRPVRKYLDCWPPTLPIAIQYRFSHFPPPQPEDVHNIFIALENPDRVCSIELQATGLLLERFSRVMQVPFPALKKLSLCPIDIGTPVVSQGFLGGSAPGLQRLSLSGKLSLTLPNFLLSCRDLVHLQLLGVSNPDHVPPEAIAASLSSLSRLEVLDIGLSTRRPCRSNHLPQALHPQSTLSALSELAYSGSGEYLEDLLARIDTPFLQEITISFQHWISDAPQLRQLICRTEGLRSPNQARIIKHQSAISLKFRQAPAQSIGSSIIRYPPIEFKPISLSIQDWQLSSAAQFCLQSVPLLSGVKRLIVDSTTEQALWQNVVGPSDWLNLFRPFSAVEELYVCRRLGSPVAFALAGATEQAEILPALRSVFFEKFASVKETINPFVAARGLSHSHMSTFSSYQF